MKRSPMTLRGAELLRVELKRLKSEDRPRVIKAIAEARGFKFTGFIAWLMWLFLHVFFLIGFRNRLAVLFEWFWAYLTRERSARLITGDADEMQPAHARFKSAVEDR